MLKKLKLLLRNVLVSVITSTCIYFFLQIENAFFLGGEGAFWKEKGFILDHHPLSKYNSNYCTPLSSDLEGRQNREHANCRSFYYELLDNDGTTAKIAK